MDQRINGALEKSDRVERLLSAMKDGLFVVNAEGEVLCVLQDVTQQRRSKGGVIAAIEAVIADTSAAGRSIIQKCFAMRQSTNQQDVTSASLDTLTEREREVLGLICQGLDDRQMSKSLGLSPNTVRNHIAALYRKIGVNRRSAALIWARERGITGDEALKPRARTARKRTEDRAAHH